MGRCGERDTKTVDRSRNADRGNWKQKVERRTENWREKCKRIERKRMDK